MKSETDSIQSISNKMQELRIINNGSTSRQVNGMSHQKAGLSNSDPQTSKKELLEQLNMIKKGKMNPAELPKVQASVQSEQTKFTKQQTLDEVNEINKNIEELINKTKYRNLKVIDSTLNFKNSLIYEKWKKSGVEVENINVEKAKINDDDEIYRYSTDDLFKLIGLAKRPEYYEHLEKLNVLRGDVRLERAFIRDLDDSFLQRLLKASSDKERMEIILKMSERRKLIKRLEGQKYEFIKVEDSQTKKNKVISKPIKSIKNDKDTDIDDHINNLINCYSDETVLNEKNFKIEFLNLFNETLDEEIKKKSLKDITQYLIDNKKAGVVEGEIRVNARNNEEAYISNPRGHRDICINRWGLRKQSLHGDFVKVLFKESKSEDATDTESSLNDTLDLESTQSNKGIFGCVLEIIEKRHSRRVIGTITGNFNKKKVSVVPQDMKVPKIQLKTESLPKYHEDDLVVVEITSWAYDKPKGKFIEILGVKGLLSTENSAILIQHNLDPTPFSQEIIDSLPNEDYVIPDEEFKYREDIRKKCIFSIDPETARDLDDAVSCEVLPNGNYEVGVHISDVSFFLKEGSKLDDIVKDKATTIYLVDTVYHMLPLPLCLLCSLLPGADKVAYSVFWEMNPETAEIINTRFTRSILNSCAKLSYEHAQMVIEKEDQNWSDFEKDFPTIYNNFTVSDVGNVIFKLQKIAKILRTKRIENGALKIDQPKISFKFTNKDQRMEAPIDFYQYCAKDSNRLIEEFMLLGNISVAKKINEKFPKVSLLRRHDPPNATAMKKLIKNLEKHGIAFDTSTSSTILESMENVISNATDRDGMNACLNLLVSKTMSRARYFCSDTANDEQDFWHYALSIPIYTHFTSPIRRYADILVHRVLNAALDYEPETQRTPEEIQRLAEICNVQKYAAKLAGGDSCNLYLSHFIETLQSRNMKVGVVGIFEYNLEVILIETGNVLKIMYADIRKQNINVQQVTDGKPPHCILSYGDKTKKIVFGSELMTKVEIIKSKLVIKTIIL
jgi:DIS3-like exonuclease 2